MKDETRDRAGAMLDALDTVTDVETTCIEVNEYIRGDPTADDAPVTGAEVELTCYISFETDENDESPFRVK